MKSTTDIFGILLIILGLAALAYQGFTYTKHEQVAQIGDVKVTADTQNTIYFPPVVGGIAVIAGIVLIAIGRRNSN